MERGVLWPDNNASSVFPGGKSNYPPGQDGVPVALRGVIRERSLSPNLFLLYVESNV